MLDNINFQQINRNKFDTGHKTPANKEATRFNNLSLTPPSEFLLQAENPIHKVTNKQLSELNSNSVLRPASAQVVAGSRGTRGALGKEGLNSHNLLNGLQLANAGKASAVNNDVTTKATQVTERANKLINKYKINMQGYKVGYIENLGNKVYAVFDPTKETPIIHVSKITTTLPDYKFAAILEHESIHAKQWVQKYYYPDPLGDALNEIEAYDAQIDFVEKHPPSDKGYIERLKGKNYRGGYYDSLSPNFTHYQKRVDQGNYRR